MKTVVVIQSNYVPWKGYFDLIHDADLFVFYDDVQYTVNDWRNRNKIKGHQGPQWLSIPVGNQNDRRICDVTLPDTDWAVKHWKTLQNYYQRAPHFAAYEPWLREVYLERRWTHLSALNQHLVTTLAREHLGLRTAFADAREFAPQGQNLDRLIDLLQKVGATHYVSGPSARAYIDASRFEAAGVSLSYKDYAGYPAYPQFHPPFAHDVSILDLLFHTGPAAPHYIWGWRQGEWLERTVAPAVDRQEALTE